MRGARCAHAISTYLVSRTYYPRPVLFTMLPTYFKETHLDLEGSAFDDLFGFEEEKPGNIPMNYVLKHSFEQHYMIPPRWFHKQYICCASRNRAGIIRTCVIASPVGAPTLWNHPSLSLSYMTERASSSRERPCGTRCTDHGQTFGHMMQFYCKRRRNLGLYLICIGENHAKYFVVIVFYDTVSETVF